MSHNKLGAALLAALLLAAPACATSDDDGADGGAVSAALALSDGQKPSNPDGSVADDEALPDDPDGSTKDPADEVSYFDTLTGQDRDNYLAKEACLAEFADDDAALWACIDAINPAPTEGANPDGSPVEGDGGDKQPPADGDDGASNPDGSPVDPADWCVGLDGADLSACQLKQSCYVQSQGDPAAYEACVASISL